jgi:hypothetical protein
MDMSLNRVGLGARRCDYSSQKRRFRCALAATMTFWAAVTAEAGVLFKDDFESGDFTATLGAAKWTNQVKVAVTSSAARSGARSAEFLFVGKTDLAADAWAELRFDLGQTYPSLWIQFEMFVPANYEHRTPVGADNNKLLRLWHTDYGVDKEKVGFSTWKNGDKSKLAADWDSGGGIGPKPQVSQDFIAPSDKGTWLLIKVFAQAAPSSTANGTLKVWKNGTLVIDDTNLMKNFVSTEKHAYRYGYILGWANSGYTSDTRFLVDDVIIATTEADLNAALASPPQAPQLEIQ